MEGKSVFINTDPAFMVINDMVRECSQQGRLVVVAMNRAFSNRIHGNCRDDMPDWGVSHFPRWHDFARTAGAVMRDYMLHATGMVTLFDPTYRNPGKTRNREGMTVNGVAINMAATKFEARCLASEFDRLFPHFVIERNLLDIEPGAIRQLHTLMYVLDENQPVLYHIVANMTVTFRGRDVLGKLVDARPFVCAIRCSFQTPGRREESPAYFRLFDLIRRFRNDVVEAEAIVNLNRMEVGNDDDEIERMVDEYFRNLPEE